jgi:hypothetical protein
MTVRFDAVLSRGGPDVLADIFGSQLIELVSTLQKDSANQANLRSLLIEVFSPEVILQSKDKRNNIIDLLRPQEARELASDIGLKDGEDIFEELKNLKIKILKLEESNIKQELFLGMTVHLEIEKVEEYERKNLYVSGKEGVIKYFLEKLK